MGVRAETRISFCSRDNSLWIFQNHLELAEVVLKSNIKLFLGEQGFSKPISLNHHWVHQGLQWGYEEMGLNILEKNISLAIENFETLTV